MGVFERWSVIEKNKESTKSDKENGEKGSVFLFVLLVHVKFNCVQVYIIKLFIIRVFNSLF